MCTLETTPVTQSFENRCRVINLEPFDAGSIDLQKNDGTT